MSLFSFHGRTRRSGYLLAVLATCGGSLATGMLMTLVAHSAPGLAVLVDLVAPMLPGLFVAEMGGVGPAAAGAVFGVLAVAVPGVASLVALSWAAGVRRLHDAGLSGWWMAAAFAWLWVGERLVASLQAGLGPTEAGVLGGAIVAVPYSLVGSLPGKRGPNRYGPDPRGLAS